LPSALAGWLVKNRLTQDVILSNMEYVLAPATSTTP
jgi:hypothetical protein